MIARLRLRPAATLIVVALSVSSLCPSLVAQEKEPAAAKPSDASGTWQWELPGPRGEIMVVLKLKQEGEKLTGTITGFGDQESEIKEGTAKDGQITFKVDRPFGNQRAVTTYTATITAQGTLKGKSETVLSREFEGKRKE
jgi:hypothetical protein